MRERLIENQCTEITKNLWTSLNRSSFDEHWDNNTVDVSRSKLATSEFFLRPILSRLKDKTILDIGCGDGVHLQYLKNKGLLIENKVYAIDISLNILKKLSQKFRNIFFLHADTVNVPMPSNSFDIVFSYGVFAYTSDIQKAIIEAVRVLKPGGSLGLYIMTQENSPLKSIFNFTRTVTKNLPIFLQHRIADIIVPLLPILPTSSNISLKNASWSQCREVVLVNIAPKNLVIPSKKELLTLLNNCPLSIFENISEPSSIIWLTKDTV